MMAAAEAQAAAQMARVDAALGLAPARGRKEAGHYRGVLMRMLTEWEQEVNDTLEEVFDEFEEGGMKAKLTATKKPKVENAPDSGKPLSEAQKKKAVKWQEKWQKQKEDVSKLVGQCSEEKHAAELLRDALKQARVDNPNNIFYCPIVATPLLSQ